MTRKTGKKQMCSTEGCVAPVKNRGQCASCYNRAYREQYIYEDGNNFGIEGSPIPRLLTSTVGDMPACVRCRLEMFTHPYYTDELQCTCGAVQYITPPRPATWGLLSSARRFLLRYCGEFPHMTDRIVRLEIRRMKNRLITMIRCPFCGDEMKQVSPNAKQRDWLDERYRCPDGHIIVLRSAKTSNAGYVGWR